MQWRLAGDAVRYNVLQYQVEQGLRVSVGIEMTDKYVVRLHTQRDRDRAMEAVRRAPEGYRLLIEEPRRTTEQSDKMHAMIRDVASQLEYHGLKLDVDSWKVIFVDALHRETRMVPNLDGTGLLALGRSTSNLSVREMQDMITLITAYGDEHGVQFKADKLLEASYTR